MKIVYKWFCKECDEEIIEKHELKFDERGCAKASIEHEHGATMESYDDFYIGYELDDG
jgi:hypothetical protein